MRVAKRSTTERDKSQRRSLLRRPSQNSLLALAIALAPDVVGVESTLLDGTSDLPARQSSGNAGEPRGVVVAVACQALASRDLAFDGLAVGVRKDLSILALGVASKVGDRSELRVRVSEAVSDEERGEGDVDRGGGGRSLVVLVEHRANIWNICTSVRFAGYMELTAKRRRSARALKAGASGSDQLLLEFGELGVEELHEGIDCL